jgi:ferredoxin
MVKATRKPLSQVFDRVKNYPRVLVVGCGGCTSVCLAGGQRECLEIAHELTLCARAAHAPSRYEVVTTERQCNPEFVEEIGDMARNADCLLSLACGAGAGLLADSFPLLPVFPALDTVFVGVDVDVGLYEERCRTCGDCRLGDTGGICPVTRCSKGSLNGPCGGTREDGSCELGEGRRCAWHDIYDRLKGQGRLESMLIVRPPMEWVDRGPRTLAQRGFEDRYAKAPVEAGGK